MGQSQVVERTFGPALVAVDCAYIGCVQNVEITVSETTRDLSCDKRIGVDGIFHYDPKLEIMLQASDFTMDNLAIALDTTGATTWAGKAAVTGQEMTIDWSGTAGSWSGTIYLNQEISGTISAYTNFGLSISFTSTESGTVTVADACKGEITLTSSGTAEPTSPLYFSYYWGDQVPSGSTIVQPSFGSTSNDRVLVIAHKKAQQSKVIVWRFWRVNVVRDFKIAFDNGSDADITIPIKLRGLVDNLGHASVPVFDVSEVDLTGWDPDYEPYSSIVDIYG